MQHAIGGKRCFQPGPGDRGFTQKFIKHGAPLAQVHGPAETHCQGLFVGKHVVEMLFEYCVFLHDLELAPGQRLA